MNKGVGAAPFHLNTDQIKWVQDTLRNMSTEQKVGQLFCIDGSAISDEILKKMVAEFGVGAILFRPLKTKAEIKEKFDSLDAIAKIPLLKAANLEEGGSGAASDGTRFFSQVGVAAAGDMLTAEQLAQVCAAEGKEAGVNWSFSPVADINRNFMNPIVSTRSFGSNAETVKALSVKYVETLQKGAVAACAKHFPGDGVDYRDQHLHPTCNSLPEDAWYRTFGAVYKAMIGAGLLSIMVGHISAPKLARSICPELTDEEAILPGSLSPALLQGVLRGKLGFNGLIVTDATIMGGFMMDYPRAEALVRSINAGCDMLVFCNDFAEDRAFLLDAVEKRKISQERLDDAVARILALKARILNAEDCGTKIDKATAQAWAAEAADKAITLVKNRTGVVPLKPGKYTKVRLICFGNDNTPDGSLKQMVTEALEREGLTVEEFRPSFRDNLPAIREIDSTRLTLLIANMEDKSNNTASRLFWFPKHAFGIPRYQEAEDSVFVSFANPFHLQDIPRIKTFINAYTASMVTVNAVIDKLFGRSAFQGTSPVDPFCGMDDTRC